MKAMTDQNYPLGIVIFLGLWSLHSLAFAQLQPNRPTFFEDGYRKLDREIQQLEEQSSEQDSLLTVDTGTLKWQKMLSREGGFSIWIPTGIYTDEIKSVPITDEILKFQVFSTNQPDSRFIVAYSNMLQPASLADIDQLLEKIVSYIIAKTDFRVTRDSLKQSREYPGYSVILASPDEIIYLQLYLINNRAYVLGVNQKSSSDLSQVSQRFFKSFQVL